MAMGPATGEEREVSPDSLSQPSSPSQAGVPVPKYQTEEKGNAQKTPKHQYPLMPLVLNEPVKRSLDYFQNQITERFQRYLDRFEIYKGLVQSHFLKLGLPPELGFLSIVESGFNPTAYSHARASGPWQFMKATGQHYGLRVTWYVDERRDPIKSTAAAARHLKDLFDRFGSWELALSAYNAGGAKISRAIKKSGSRNFWEIRKSWHIRRETKEYVPSFIAATLIALDPTKYGFVVPPTTPYAYDEVLIHKRAHLESVAEATGISLRDLKGLNPELVRFVVPLVQGGYPLKVPKGKGFMVQQRQDQIEMWTKLPPDSVTWYQVRFGDTLEDVAHKFGLTVQRLRQLNKLPDNTIRWNDRLRLRRDEDILSIEKGGGILPTCQLVPCSFW